MKLISISNIVVLTLLTTICFADSSPPNRPTDWERPITMDGVQNLHKVSSTIYRSAQPDAKGMINLKAMGIETIINLRSFHSDREEIGDSGLAYEHIYMKTWHPEKEDVVRFFQIVTNPKQTPVLVHCQHGDDRTETMVALYRVAIYKLEQRGSYTRNDPGRIWVPWNLGKSHHLDQFGRH